MDFFLIILLFMFAVGFFKFITFVGRKTAIVGFLLIPLIVILLFKAPDFIKKSFISSAESSFITEIIKDYSSKR